MGCSSSDWWRAPVYFTVSAVLAFMAVSTAIHSIPNNSRFHPAKPTNLPLSLNASRVLSRSGFKSVATLLHLSPEIFLSSLNSTIFAIQDSAFLDISLPPWILKNLLHYHTSPLRLPMADLLKMPQGSCFETLVPRKKLAITKNSNSLQNSYPNKGIDSEATDFEINHVKISHPDMFLDNSIVIHGVLGPFTPVDPQNLRQGWDYIRSPVCDAKSNMVITAVKENNNEVIEIEWIRIIRLLSSTGFVPFAISLHSVLDRILEEHKNLTAITVLAPPNFASVATSSSLLYNFVSRHILNQRLMYTDLASFTGKAQIKTLIPNQDLVVTGGDELNSSVGRSANVARIMAPDMFSYRTFVIHGISQAMETPQLNALV